MEKQLLTVEQTADVLGIGKTKVYQYISSNELQSVKLGKARRIKATSIEDLIKRRTWGVNET